MAIWDGHRGCRRGVKKVPKGHASRVIDPWLPPPHSVWGATQPLRIQADEDDPRRYGYLKGLDRTLT